ncbi:MAG: TIGR00266 family protein [Deltaproteobacteria bacterium]|nr:TIGR00266 family protein [Deltaproteobacteria bacterium]
MQSSIQYGPAYAMATIDLAPGESVTVEAGSMMGMSDGLEIKTHIGGNKSGFFGALVNFLLALVRKFLGGETFFVNTYSPPASRPGRVMVAPAMSGDIVRYQMDGVKSLMVQATSYLASAGDVVIKTKFGGLKSLFSGEGAFWLLCSGKGDLWVNCYGAIHEVDVQDRYVVDTGHIVAFDDTLDYKIKGSGSLKSTLLSGEGLTCHFSGHGKLFIQSRNLGGLVHWITPRLPA